MLIFISYDYILICCLDYSVHFWAVWRGIVVLNFKFVAQLSHHLIVQIFAIISNASARQFVPAYQFFSYELRYYFTRDIGIRGNIHPFGKIINCYQDETMFIWCLWLYRSSNIYTPHRERPWRSVDIQRCRCNINFVRIHLTFVTFSHMYATVVLHGQPEVTSPQYFPSHRMAVHMSPESSFVNFSQDRFCFFGINTPEENMIFFCITHPHWTESSQPTFLTSVYHSQ